MYSESITQELYNTIQKLMKEPLLNDFYLGGGTCLALKYNYRVSTDIDLFSHEVVGKERMKEISEILNQKFGNEGKFGIKNDTSENLSFVVGGVLINGIDIKIEIIQNMRFAHPFEEKEGIRLINDLDIGALKLLSAVGRGTRKDFYDLYYLSNIYGIDRLYEELMYRHEIFTGKECENIFNIPTGKPLNLLEKDVTPLCDFSNANLTQYNKVVITDPELKQKSWFDIAENWKKKVAILAKLKGLELNEIKTENKRRKNRL